MESVGVIGGGQMGAGIAEVCVRAGQQVILVESSAEAAEAASQRLVASLSKAEATGKVASATEILDRIEVVDDLAALADRSLVIEAIVAEEAAKTELFRKLDQIVTDRYAILASNTSSIPIMTLGVATSRPEHVIGVHVFNPVPVLSLVELVPSILTKEKTKPRARAFVQEFSASSRSTAKIEPASL